MIHHAEDPSIGDQRFEKNLRYIEKVQKKRQDSNDVRHGGSGLSKNLSQAILGQGSKAKPSNGSKLTEVLSHGQTKSQATLTHSQSQGISHEGEANFNKSLYEKTENRGHADKSKMSTNQQLQ